MRTNLINLLKTVTGTVLSGLTVLAVQNPNCVIVSSNWRLWDAFQGKCINCSFFHDGQLNPPVTFMCAAWCQCLWTYAGDDIFLRKVEVMKSEDGNFSMNITAIEDRDKDDHMESTGYIFHLDDEGELRWLCTELALKY